MLEEEKEQGVTEEGVETPSTQTDVETDGQPVAEEQAGHEGAAKTYTEEELNSKISAIMHERTKQMSEELNMYRSFGTPQDLYKKITSTQTPAPKTQTEPAVELSEEDKEFLGYMEKKVPGWKKMQEMAAKWDALQDNIKYIESMKTSQNVQLQQFTKESIDAFDTICKKYGISDGEQKTALEETVANLVKSNPALITKYQRGDISYVNDAFAKVAGMIGLKEKAAVNSVEARTKIANLPKSMPKGGINAPITKKNKLSDDERVDTAFSALTGA